MCLILFALSSHPRYKMVVAANRDEFYKRPTAPAHWWHDHNDMLAGKDLQAGGTWMGITRKGKFAALTNFRGTLSSKRDTNAKQLSRGHLVSSFLSSDIVITDFFDKLEAEVSAYDGFNLLFGDGDHLYYYSNTGKTNSRAPLEPGVYGLSNDVLDTPWPKVERGKAGLKQMLQIPGELDLQNRLFTLLSDDRKAPFKQLPDTGVGKLMERSLSPLFIKLPLYGTRSSTVLLMEKGRIRFCERGVVPRSLCSQEFDLS